MMRTVPIRELADDVVAPYGWMLGKPLPEGGPLPRYSNPRTDFWQAHVFDAQGGEPELLWVNYRDASTEIGTLETHRRTEQAVVPLTGEIVQVVAASGPDGLPDLGTVAALRIAPGHGICMRPGCWHATRVAQGEVRCLMLTRRSTTLDLIAHLDGGATMRESALAAVALRLG